ncbi:hypothetical protein AVEN_81709-1 [Araneus ventricosus]|uniref:Uncharacterized protein n=1 Tax=Araneus ventricosus TaxID=182803 RepID=A0A4Y2IAZ4_ARAVE|nr:hypothetical protein AVEN_81709-1 [Araneus ventricosus]
MVFMTRVEPFGKVRETFASQRETWFSVRFRQAFITSLFQAFQKAVKSPPAVNEIRSPSPLQSRTPKEGSNTPCSKRTRENKNYSHHPDRSKPRLFLQNAQIAVGKLTLSWWGWEGKTDGNGAITNPTPTRESPPIPEVIATQ